MTKLFQCTEITVCYKCCFLFKAAVGKDGGEGDSFVNLRRLINAIPTAVVIWCHLPVVACER
jgi:hypothetical protein